MYKAIFSLAYYGLMRIGELTWSDHVMLAKDIHIATNRDRILIVLHSSKTHGRESRPQNIRIEALYMGRHSGSFCPFKTARQFMAIRGNYITDDEPFFIFSDGVPVKPNQVRKKLSQALTSLGLDSSLYGMHSMRSGRATDMYKLGNSIQEIKVAGRWQSGAFYKYLKP